MKNPQTIAAISTPQGEGGIGVIRVSGPDALDIGLKAFEFSSKTPSQIRPRYLYRGSIFDRTRDEKIDSGFFAYMKAPASYTGEDTVELFCHGGPLVLKKALELLFKHGARPAQPGEFTKRAFLNDKMDLTQAEAVIDLIKARTEYALSSARLRLQGSFSKKVEEIKQELLGLAAHIEAELDFSEDEIDALGLEAVLNTLHRLKGSISGLLSTYEEGRAIREGVRVLILGRPNAGKSSLLNVLLNEERAIVTEIPGTTRDIIEEVLNIRGMAVRLMDTAGLRETQDIVESLGVRAARERIEACDLIIFVIDSSTGDHEEDRRLLESFGGKKTVIAANKSDLASSFDGKSFAGYKVVPVSALKSTGIEELKDAVMKEACGRAGATGAIDAGVGELVVSLRHKDLLEKALESVVMAEQAAAAGTPKEFIATDIRFALDRLGEITGETTTEDILGRIFDSFCIGK